MTFSPFRPFNYVSPHVPFARTADANIGRYWEDQYLQNLWLTMTEGNDRIDRTGDGTRSLFCRDLKVDLQQAFPLVTTKKMGLKPIILELVWFLQGKCNERDLAEIMHGTRDPSKTTIWTQNANADYWKPKATHEGDLGRVYGVQWRTWTNSDGEVFDQITNVIEQLKTNPASRRLIVTAWNPGELHKMALPPCHMFMQFHVDFIGEKKYLNLSMTMRSTDSFLGEPFNIASYAALVHMIAHLVGMEVGTLAMRYTDYHIYSTHFDQVAEQLKRQPHAPPKLVLKNLENVKTIDDFTMDNFELVGYTSEPSIKAPMSV